MRTCAHVVPLHLELLPYVGVLVFGPSDKIKTRPVEECCFKPYVHADMHTDIHARVRTCIHPLKTCMQTYTDINAHVGTCIHPHINLCAVTVRRPTHWY